MADRFDGVMRNIAAEADAKVDYAAMKAAILQRAAAEPAPAAEREPAPHAAPQAQHAAHRHKKRAMLYRNLAAAAALVLLAGGTGYVMGSGGSAAKSGASGDMAALAAGAQEEGEAAMLRSADVAAAADLSDAALPADGEAVPYGLTLNPVVEVPKTAPEDSEEELESGLSPEGEEDPLLESGLPQLAIPMTDPAADTALSASSSAAGEPAAAGGSLTDYRDYMIRQYHTMLVNRSHTLEEDYEPVSLVNMKEYNDSGNLTIKRSQAYGDITAVMALNEMMEAAKAEGVEDFCLVSSYRDYAYQQDLWDAKVEKDPTYGADPAVPVVTAYPGTSEHQTGLAFDITAVHAVSMEESFADTEQGQWLAANSYRFGFILRYPKGKEDITGVVYEPWHFRYVGVELATYLYENGLVLEEFYEGM